MDSYSLSIVFAGFLYVITPGPVFLAILTLIAERGRFVAVRLLSGSLIGSMFWLVFTTASIIEASKLPPVILQILTFFCSTYLCWLAYKMFKNARKPGSVRIFHRPTLDGMTLGFLNPKSYPVMLSVFSALILGQGEPMIWADFPLFFVLAVLGFVLAYVVLIALFGLSAFKKFYLRFSAPISYLFGVLYLGFGLNLLLNALYEQRTSTTK